MVEAKGGRGVTRDGVGAEEGIKRDGERPREKEEEDGQADRERERERERKSERGRR